MADIMTEEEAKGWVSVLNNVYDAFAQGKMVSSTAIAFQIWITSQMELGGWRVIQKSVFDCKRS